MTPFVPFNLHRTILISAILRLALIVYDEWQDSRMVVRYTDIDYSVFSDAADLVLKGNSPFERSVKEAPKELDSKATSKDIPKDEKH
ncbi:uncharacterized protein A4U43_C03F8080 [Asparagus officinalis]|uniref:GPI mannosyltransferase I n=1 Tax=Asparagus officinalis TaxID=4686 RepID=A0A5P1F8U4_ASPOF|nr:uncharacterized protein A4U43_C03F8080 [Asparagus officinalis]